MPIPGQKYLVKIKNKRTGQICYSVARFVPQIMTQQKLTEQEYNEKVKDLLAWMVEFPNIYLHTDKTNREIKESYEQKLSIQEAANVVCWGPKK